MAYTYILFDLDGTLTDPALGITNSIRYALEKFGIAVEDRTALYPCIGPPLMDSFQRFWHFDEGRARRAVVYYREYFSKTGLFENQVYPGIPALLAKLQAQGKKLCLATSKPEEYSAEILRHFGLLHYFTFLAGNTLADTRPQKVDVLHYLQETFPDLSADNAVMVGDRIYDVEAAKAVGLPSIAVLFGYGSREELTRAGADQLVETVSQLQSLLICG